VRLGHLAGRDRESTFGFVLQTVIEVHRRAGRTAQAATEADQLVALEKVLGSDSPIWVQFLRVAGPAWMDAGQPAKAHEALERALRLSARHPFFPGWVPELKYQLARASLADGGDRERSAILVQQAHDELAALPQKKKLLAEVDAWREKMNFH
jgi:hypothetical protein